LRTVYEQGPTLVGRVTHHLNQPLRLIDPEFPLADGEEISPYFVPYGSYSPSNHYVIQATMIDNQNPPIVHYPIAIYNSYPDFVIEFDLPADDKLRYTLVIIDAFFCTKSITDLRVV
jgi:hypothetical protein